jgi:hypothetical protein
MGLFGQDAFQRDSACQRKQIVLVNKRLVKRPPARRAKTARRAEAAQPRAATAAGPLLLAYLTIL